MICRLIKFSGLILVFCWVLFTEIFVYAEGAQKWYKHCSVRICTISQIVSSADGVTVLDVKIGRLPGLYLLATFPLGIWLREGWSWHVDGNPPKQETIDVCVPEGCLIGIRLTPEHIRQFEQGRWLHVNFRDSKLQPVEVKLSLIGFTAAYASLAAE